MTRSRFSVCLIVLVASASAVADKIYLQDGRKLSGTAKRSSDVVELVTDEGRKLVFAKEDVKRVVFESTSTPNEVLDMLDEFEDLIAPAMGLGEPTQREFGKTSTSVRARNIPLGDRPRRYDDRDFVTDHTPAREVISSDKFVDDWVRFSAHFEAVAKTRTYKHHTRAKRRTPSLAEFGRFTPEKYEEVGAVVCEAIDAVKETFELAEKANKALAGARIEDLNQDRLIAKARDRSRRTNARSNSTGEERRVAQARVDKLIDDKVVRMKQAQLGADNAVNDVAAARIIAIQQLAELRGMLEEAIVPEPAPVAEAP